MKQFLSSLYDDLIQSKIEFERVMLLIRNNGLFSIIESDMKTIFKELKKMPQVERDNYITILLRYGTYRLKMSGYDENQLLEIQKTIRSNLEYAVDNDIDISMESLYDYSIKSWEESALSLNNILKNNQSNERENIKKVTLAAGNLIAGGSLLVLDAQLLKQEQSPANLQSFFTCAAFFLNVIAQA